MKGFRVSMWALLLLLVPCMVLASSVQRRSLKERAQDADRIAWVQVLEQETHTLNGRLQTVTRLSVAEYWKGGGPETLEVIQWGGTSGLYSAHVAGDASFSPLETAVLLLRCRDVKRPERCRLMALGEGKIRIEGSDAFVFRLDSGTSTKLSMIQLRETMGLARTPPQKPVRFVR